MEKLKDIEIKIGRPFRANNVIYTATKSLSIERYVRASNLVQDIGRGVYGVEEDEKKVLTRIFNNANKGNLAEVAVIAHNRLTELKEQKNLGNPILRLCALYINAEGEDLRGISEEEELKKIEDWAKEGLSFQSFLIFGMPLVQNILQEYKEHIEDILRQRMRLEEIVKDISSISTSILEEQERRL